MSYIIFATDSKGEGRVQNIGTFDNVGDISILVGMFADDVEITIEERPVELVDN
jgi:hypothetical protein